MDSNFRGSPDSHSSDAALGQISRSLPNDSLLLGTGMSPKGKREKLKEFGSALIQHISPRSHHDELPLLASGSDSLGIQSGDEEGPRYASSVTEISELKSSVYVSRACRSLSPISRLSSSFFHKDTVTESPRIQHTAPSKPSSVISDSVSADVAASGHQASELSKHRLKKVESTRTVSISLYFW